MKKLSKTIATLTLIAAGLLNYGCGPTPKDKSTKVSNLKSGADAKNIQPTSGTATPIEGLWASDCFPGDYPNGMKSLDIGYIFKGNSFFLERDYYADDNCRYGESSIQEARQAGNVISEAACGWFTTASGTNGLRTIDMLSATNCGPSEFNVYKIVGTGDSAALWLGDGGRYPTHRPTTANIQYGRWDGKN